MLTIFDRLKSFGRDDRGVFAVIFGILAIVLVATAGAVVDYTTVEQARARAQDALDSAALGLQPRIYEDRVTEEQLRVEAQRLLTERLANEDVTATVDDAQIDDETGMLRFRATIGVPTTFVRLVGVDWINASVVAEVKRGALDIEVALALDVTGSMTGSRITAAKRAAIQLVNTVVQDDQTPNYSKLALIPWSNAVNVGSYAANVRGPVTGSTSITGARWLTTGSSYVRTIRAISKASPARITTSGAHGFTTGQTVNISNVSGGGFTVLNGRSFTITVVDNTRFTLDGVSTSGVTGNYTTDSGIVTMGSARAISSISKANPAVVTTSMAHGLATGDAVYLTSLSGGTFASLSNDWYTVTVTGATQFRLNGINTSGYGGTYNSNSGVMRECLTNECEVVITSTAHGLANDEHVYITGENYLNSVGGDGEVTDVYRVTDVTANTYVLEDSEGPRMSNYTSGALSWCTRPGCEYFYFDNDDDNPDYSLHRIRTCVTERVGADLYSDAAPRMTYVGRHYTASSSDCLSSQITPLTSNKLSLIAQITALQTSGTTAGQIGTAWAWYMISPNFGYLFPNASQRPAAYDAPHVKKIAIIMTDGEYNTPYCSGVVARDNTANVRDEEVINCNATNGTPLSQATSMCTGMKARGITVYTVGFQLGSDTRVINMLRSCASSPSHAYLAANDAELMRAFEAIADDISDLRLTE